MRVINYTEIPRTEAEDINREKTVWRNGKCVSLDEGRHVTLYVGHKEETRVETEQEESRQVMTAFAIRVEKPLTKEKAINAAEMEAYALASAMEVASLNASLARKWRENINDKDVSDHDEFIRWVKQELDATGLFTPSSDRVDTNSPTIGDVIALSRIVAVSTEMTNEQALSVKRIFPDWKAGISVKVGEKYNYNGVLYKVIQAHTTQADWKPSETASLYTVVSASTDEEHAGTLDDPIPYVQNMALEIGKYYEQYGVVYLCIQGTITGYQQDLYQMPAIATPV